MTYLVGIDTLSAEMLGLGLCTHSDYSQAHKAKQKMADRTEGSQDRSHDPTQTP